MIDVERIIGFNMCAFNEASLWDIKIAITKVTQELDSDDLFLVGDACCRGSDEGSAFVLNAPLCRRIPDFIKMTRINFHSVGLTDIDCPKQVFVVSEMYDDILKSEIKKWHNISKQRRYDCEIVSLILNQEDELVSSFNQENLKEKIYNAIHSEKKFV